MLAIFPIAGALLNLFGSLSYVRDTLKGRTKPNRVTWGMWAIAPLIATAASLSSGVTWAVLPVFMSSFCPFLILIASFVNKNAYWELSKFDYVCGALSVVALVLWYLSKDPNVAIVFAILSDASAGVPTLIKAWKYPDTESPLAFVLAAISGLSSLPALTMWTFAGYAFPIYLIFLDGLIAMGILRPRR